MEVRKVRESKKVWVVRVGQNLEMSRFLLATSNWLMEKNNNSYTGQLLTAPDRSKKEFVSPSHYTIVTFCAIAGFDDAGHHCI